MEATIAGTLAVQLPAAELFYVSADMTDLARHAADTLTDYRLHPEDLPAQIGVMVYEHPPVDGTAVWVGDRGRCLRRGHHDEVVVHLSSVLFVMSGGRVVARVLSEDEIRLLAERLELLRGPAEILEALAQRDIAPTNGRRSSNNLDRRQHQPHPHRPPRPAHQPPQHPRRERRLKDAFP